MNDDKIIDRFKLKVLIDSMIVKIEVLTDRCGKCIDKLAHV